MKLTTIILMISLMQVSAATFGQKVTLMENNVTLERVFWEIHKQTGYDVLIKNTSFKTSQRINVKFKETELDQVMDQVVKGTDLTYTIEDKTVVIKEKENPSFLEKILDRFNNIDVSGKILDENGKPLPGASVKVKKTGKAVSTDKDGKFFLRGVEEDAVLVVSFIGYLPKEVSASANIGSVVLEQSLSKLDEIQVIAYGTTTQRLSTGNVTTIKADVIEKQPVNNPLLALQGRVPGLFIEQATGFAGTGVKVRIQGQNSIINGNDPLYVIDGIPFTSTLLDGGNLVLRGAISDAGSPLNFINPMDIESIDVLKDADATAIYGSRAANGAILITTKKGKAGEIMVDINFQNGWGQVSRKLDLMNGQQYLEMRREALKNDGVTTLRSSDWDLNGTWDNTRSTDWQKTLIGGRAQYRDVQSSISGGSNLMSFLVGAGYHKEGNVFPGNFNDTKRSVHFNTISASANQRFKVQFSGSYMQDDNMLPAIDLTNLAMTLTPVAPNLYNQDGTINWQPNTSGASTFLSNPMGYLYQKFKNTTENLIANSMLSYEVISGLYLKTNLGYTKLQSNTIFTSPPTIPEDVVNGNRYTTFGSNNTKTWSIEPQLTYQNNISRGKIEILLGATFQKENRDGSSIIASGFSSNQVMEDIKSATLLTSGNSISSLYKYNAVFARVNYNWQEKYILNFTARRDGSSRFGSNNHFHNFGAVGFGWIFSQEHAIKNNLSILSFGKLRGSYGTTGSDQIRDYQFLSLYDAISGITSPYQGINSYQPLGLTNPYLQWEETKKIQFGLDLGLFNDRILLNTNYYLNRSSNQLMNYDLPIMTGFNSVVENLPATLQNTGFEVTLSTTNFETKKFKWTSSINITLPKNKLIAYPNISESSYFNTKSIGQSVNMILAYHFLGVDPATGLYQFSGRNNNATGNPIPVGTPNDDALIRINPDPKFYGGFQNSFSYMGFQVDILFQFTKQVGKNYLFGSGVGMPGRFGGTGNQPISLLDRWQKPGDITSSERYSANLSGPAASSWKNIFGSDAIWSDASYIRLKNLSISWELPENYKKIMHLKRSKLYLQGQNLFTITKYAGLDPESKSSLSLPPLRVLTFGVQIRF